MLFQKHSNARAMPKRRGKNEKMTEIDPHTSHFSTLVAGIPAPNESLGSSLSLSEPHPKNKLPKRIFQRKRLPLRTNTIFEEHQGLWSVTQSYCVEPWKLRAAENDR